MYELLVLSDVDPTIRRCDLANARSVLQFMTSATLKRSRQGVELSCTCRVHGVRKTGMRYTLRDETQTN